METQRGEKMGKEHWSKWPRGEDRAPSRSETREKKMRKWDEKKTNRYFEKQEKTQPVSLGEPAGSE